MPKKFSRQAKEILDALFESGDNGLTLKEISKRVEEEACGHDCESWIKTFLEAGIIEICGKVGNANLFRLTKKGREALV
jgi:chromosome segregation and condensation protein ScpB